jgi:1-acyl-sn-glycerol-3-phosphate acyltransferase
MRAGLYGGTKDPRKLERVIRDTRAATLGRPETPREPRALCSGAVSEAAKPRHSAIDRTKLYADVAMGLSAWGAGEQARLQETVGKELAAFSDAELAEFAARLTGTGATWGFHAHDPIARRVSRLAQSSVLKPGSALEASESLERARKGPVFFVANHLSYVDANILDALFVAAGYQDVADKLTVLVGPKVFQTPTRRLASLCFGTIKIPQSQSIASEEAVMPRREVARLAEQTLQAVAERHRAGEHVMIFIEGTRSRTGSMQRVLAATARYFETEGAVILPVGLWGTENLVPLDRMQVTPAVAHAHAGRPVAAADVSARAGGKRPIMADALGFLIAHQLPPQYRGVYTDDTPGLEAARAAAATFSG